MKILKSLVAPIVAALLLASCAGTPTAAQNSLPAICIVSGEDASDGPTADYMGHTVNFCCDDCKAKWDGMDAAAQKAKWEKLAK
jgi:hypothetical protein